MSTTAITSRTLYAVACPLLLIQLLIILQLTVHPFDRYVASVGTKAKLHDVHVAASVPAVALAAVDTTAIPIDTASSLNRSAAQELLGLARGVGRLAPIIDDLVREVRAKMDTNLEATELLMRRQAESVARVKRHMQRAVESSSLSARGGTAANDTDASVAAAAERLLRAPLYATARAAGTTAPPAHNSTRHLFSDPAQHSWRRAVAVYFGPVKPEYYATELRSLYTSWAYVTDGGADTTDLIIFHHPDVLAHIPREMHCVPPRARDLERGQCVRVEHRPRASRFLDKDYAVASSVEFLSGPAAAILDEYELVLRSDTDCFLAPGWRYFFPHSLVVSAGGYAMDYHRDATVPLLLAAARRLGVRHRGVHNIGSSWAGPGWQVRRLGQLAYNFTEWVFYHGDFDNDGRGLLDASVTDAQLRARTAKAPVRSGTWPTWYRLVSLLYGSELALNAMFPKLQIWTPMLDVSCSCSAIDVDHVAHLHVYQGPHFFSKTMWRDGAYRDIDTRDFSLHTPCLWALEMAMRAEGRHNGTLQIDPLGPERHPSADETVHALIKLRKESHKVYDRKGLLESVASPGRCAEPEGWRLRLRAASLPEPEYEPLVLHDCDALSPVFRYNETSAELTYVGGPDAKTWCVDAWTQHPVQLYGCSHSRGNQAWQIVSKDADEQRVAIINERWGECLVSGGPTAAKGVLDRAECYAEKENYSVWRFAAPKTTTTSTPSLVKTTT